MADDAKLTEVVTALREAERSVRVLSRISWPFELRERFLAKGGRELPVPQYEPFDARDVCERIAAVRRRIDVGDPVQAWLGRVADQVETAARMLAAIGTPEFLDHGRALYGSPGTPLLDGESTPLQLAEQVEELSAELAGLDLGEPPPSCHDARSVADGLRAACRRLFGDDAPTVEVVDSLSANALAGPLRVRVRRGACFGDRDLQQLIHHEVYVHVVTSKNGGRQTALPILAASHAGTTRTQEGLAVFAEMISGTMGPQRFRRLADRVRAIQMAIDGADFRDVFEFFVGRIPPGATPEVADEQAFENARRVFRGGMVTGGVPFLKDVVYLGGLLRVTEFLRTVVAAGRVDCLLLLFCGKLDVEDVPALAHAAERGLVRPPKYLPPWIADRRFLVAYLAFQRFLGGVDPANARRHYREMLAGVPRLASFGGDMA